MSSNGNGSAVRPEFSLKDVPVWVGMSISILVLVVGGAAGFVNVSNTADKSRESIDDLRNQATSLAGGLEGVRAQVNALDKRLAELIVEESAVRAEVDRRGSRIGAMELEIARLRERLPERWPQSPNPP